MKPRQIRFGYPKLQIEAIMREAKIGDEVEAIYVGSMVWRHMRNTKDLLPKITEHSGLQFASRSLVSLGFFKEYMDHLWKNHGAPHPNFYLEVSIAEFAAEGQMALASHLEDWTSYLHDRFQIKESEDKQGIRVANVYEKSRYHKSFPDTRTWKRPGFLSEN